MTTKEEVARLAESAGFQELRSWPGVMYLLTSEMLDNRAITKLIELAKQAGAAEEREACLKICEDFNQLAVESSTRLSSAFECAEAIRNRERKE